LMKTKFAFSGGARAALPSFPVPAKDKDSLQDVLYLWHLFWL
jgi:hypothetical protein